MIKLTKAEADLLLPMGQREFGGTVAELRTEVTNAYWVIDDSPFPYWEREKQMKILQNLAAKHDFTIGL